MPLADHEYRVFIFRYEGGRATGLDIGHHGVSLPEDEEVLMKAFRYAKEKYVK